MTALPRLHREGLVGAQAASWVALGPSLVPRRWWTTAASTAAHQVAGYALGALVRAVRLRVRRRRSGLPVHRPDRPGGRAGRVLATAALGGTALSLVRGHAQQVHIARLVDSEHAGGQHQVAGFAVGSAAALGTLYGGRVIWARNRAVAGGVRRISRHRVGPAVALAASTALLMALDRLVLRGVLHSLARRPVFGNGRRARGRRAPLEPERSGSPASPEAFAALGRHGQAMVSDGPRARDITGATGDPAAEPIRVFVGRAAHPDLHEAAEALVAELHRTGAFDRPVLVAFVGSSSGWVQEWALEAVEYLTGGRCACASLQYSFAPSWLAFLIERESAREAARVLVDRLRRELGRLPADRRPRLYVTGESIGAYAGHGAFGDLDAMLRDVAGVVWAGTPRLTRLWEQLVAGREEGSTELVPVVGGGRHVRFVSRPAELWRRPDGRAYPAWEFPRVVYAQHPSDPVVWWGPRLIWRRPDWMRELSRHPSPDVSAGLRWLPWATFWQITVDMPRSLTVPGGHGHSYRAELLPVWAAVLDVAADPARLRAIERAIRATIRPH